MKKMLIVLLSLGIILSGCIQNENPEEPPVVEDEAEKQPTINEDIIIDIESSDNEKDDESNLGNEIVDGPNDNGQKYDCDEKDYICVIEKKDRKLEELDLDLSNYAYTDFDDNDLFQWMAIDLPMTLSIQKLFINYKSDNADELNNIFFNLYENNRYLFSEYKWKTEENILFIIRKYGTIGVNSYGSFWHQIYYFDLDTGKRLTNDDLLNKFDIEKENINDIIYQYAKNNKLGFKPADIGEEIPNPELDNTNGMIMASKVINDSVVTGYTYQDNSVLLIEDGQLFLIVGVMTPTFRNLNLFHKIRIE